MFRRRQTISLGASAAVFTCATLLTFARSSRAWAYDHHGKNHDKVFPPGPRPFSVASTYSDWAARWWQWAFTIPNSINPTLDLTGANCNQGQSGPVFFLAGTPSTTPITRSCTIPGSKALLLPLITSECSNVEPAPFFGGYEAQLRACVKQFLDGVSLGTLKLAIDGVAVPNLASFRVQSVLYTSTVPADNQLGVPGGTSPISVADGFFVMLQPLSQGHHTIHFEAAMTSGPGAGFSQNVSYNLLVRGD